MEIVNFENKPVLENKIEGPINNELEINPERGGIPVSMKFDGKEILYMDYERFNNPDKSDRGGIPILFPIAGPKTKEGPFSELNQHGFARDLPWEIEKNENGELIETLKSNDETLKKYPHEFILKMKTRMGEDGGITLIQEVENKGDNEMPISMGLHPYFNVPEGNKDEIKFNFESGENIEKKIKEWLALDEQEGGYGAFMERIDNQGEEISIYISGIGTIEMDISKEYEKIWIWTERDKNFICIEPVMRDNQNGEIVDGPKMIKKGEKFSANVKYSLEK